MTDDPVVVVPADLDVEDRLIGPVTFGAAAWLAVGAAGVALVVFAGGQPAAAATGVLLAAVGVAGAVWRPGGRSAAGWIGPVTAYFRRVRGGSQSVDVETPATPTLEAEPVSGVAPRRVLARPPSVLAVAAAVVVLATGAWVVVMRSRGPASPVAPRPAGQPLPQPPPASPFSAPPTEDVPPLWWYGDDDPFWFDCDC